MKLFILITFHSYFIQPQQAQKTSITLILVSQEVGIGTKLFRVSSDGVDVVEQGI